MAGGATRNTQEVELGHDGFNVGVTSVQPGETSCSNECDMFAMTSSTAVPICFSRQHPQPSRRLISRQNYILVLFALLRVPVIALCFSAAATFV